MLYYPHNQGLEQLVKAGFIALVDGFLETMLKRKTPYNIKEFTGRDISEILRIDKYKWQLFFYEMDYDFYLHYKDVITIHKLNNGQLKTISDLALEERYDAFELREIFKGLRALLDFRKTGLFERLYKPDELIKYLCRVDKYQAVPMRTAVRLLRQYIENMSKLGISPDLFTKNLRKEYDISKRNVMTMNRRRAIDGFSERVEILQKYTYEDDSLFVAVPETPADLLREGRQNHNCVGDYIEDQSSGRSNVFFIRKKTDPTMSYITVELTSDFQKTIDVRYGYNKIVTDKRDLEFIQKWLNHNKEVHMREMETESYEEI